MWRYVGTGLDLLPCLPFRCSYAERLAIPMATDIAFSLGVLAVFKTRVPVGLKVFLAALAVADDLGGIIVIALFYSSEINFLFLALALLCILVLVAGKRH